jgi:putative lipase involved disintegration of autophagic bodies
MATRTFPFSYKPFDVLLCMHARYVCMLSYACMFKKSANIDSKIRTVAKMH